MIIDRANSVLVIVDMQERLVPAVADADRVVGVAGCLAGACRIMGIPIVITEHCPNRIGGTVAALGEARREATIVTKTHFNALAQDEGLQAFRRIGRTQPIVCGTEAHVCVLQSVLGLRQHDFEPLVVADGVSSRKPLDRDVALSRMAAAGVGIVTAEMALFEWLERAETDEFRRVLPLIKALQA
jgi:nicotinamidase-related amidase